MAAINVLRDLLEKPGSFTGTPGYQFALDAGLDAVNRKMAASGMRNSGNVLGAMARYASGYAAQNFLPYLNTVAGIADSERRGGHDERRLDLEEIEGDRRHELGKGNLGLGFYRAGNEYELGTEQNANTAQRNRWDYDLGRDRNVLTAAGQRADQEAARANNELGWYTARTGRGTARSGDYWRGREFSAKASSGGGGGGGGARGWSGGGQRSAAAAPDPWEALQQRKRILDSGGGPSSPGWTWG